MCVKTLHTGEAEPAGDGRTTPPCPLPPSTHPEIKRTTSHIYSLALCTLDSRWQPIIELTEQSSGRHPVTPSSPAERHPAQHSTDGTRLGGRVQELAVPRNRTLAFAPRMSLFPLVRGEADSHLSKATTPADESERALP